MKDYCDETINTCKETVGTAQEVTNCLTQQKTAQADFDKEKKVLDIKIQEKRDEIADLKKKYDDCVILVKKTPGVENWTPYELQKAINDNRQDKLDAIPPIEALIVPLYDEIAELQKRLNCANNSASTSRINFIGSTTSFFKLSKINVGNEANLNIFDITDKEEKDRNILNRILKLMTQVIGTFAVLMLIIGAYYMITSQGDESQLQKGKNIFFYTVIGLLIAFMSFITVQFVLSIIFTSTG